MEAIKARAFPAPREIYAFARCPVCADVKPVKRQTFNPTARSYTFVRVCHGCLKDS